MTQEKPLITLEDVAHVAGLAHLSFTPEESVDYADKLGAILSYMQELQDIDTAGIPLTTHPLPLTNVFREDSVGATLPREAVLANAPEQQEGCFKVPKIL